MIASEAQKDAPGRAPRLETHVLRAGRRPGVQASLSQPRKPPVHVKRRVESVCGPVRVRPYRGGALAMHMCGVKRRLPRISAPPESPRGAARAPEWQFPRRLPSERSRRPAVARPRNVFTRAFRANFQSPPFRFGSYISHPAIVSSPYPPLSFSFSVPLEGRQYGRSPVCQTANDPVQASAT